MKNTIGNLRKSLNANVVIRDEKEKQLKEYEKELSVIEKEKAEWLEVRAFFQAVIPKIHSKLEHKISGLVTMAEAAVFDDPYTFRTKFVTRRNQTECDFFFEKRGNSCSDLPFTAGGGACDIASLALRMIVESMTNNRRTLIWDEPMKNLSVDMRPLGMEVIKTLSEELGFQVIVNSHDPELIEMADRIIHVTQENGRSKIKTTSNRLPGI